MRWIVALVLMLSVQAMAVTSVFTASGTADDAMTFSDGADAFAIADRDSMIIGYDSGSPTYPFRGAAIMFRGVTIPNNATITAVTLKMKTKTAFTIGVNSGISATVWIYDGDNHTSLGTGVCYTGTGYYAWQVTGDVAANTEMNIDCGTSSLSTVIARSGWASGNNIGVYICDDGSSDMRIVMQSIATYAHTLTVTYTVPTSGMQRYRVFSSANDCTDDGSGTYLTESFTYLESGYDNGFRFQAVQIPTGSTIDTSVVEFLPYDLANNGTVVNQRIKCEAVDDAATFTNHTDFAARTRTTAYTDWSSISSWTFGTRYDSPNFKTSLQEVINRAGWAAGNDAVVFIKDNVTTGGSRAAYCSDGSAALSPVMRVRYSVASSGTSPKSRRRILQMGDVETRFPIYGQWGATCGL